MTWSFYLRREGPFSTRRWSLAILVPTRRLMIEASDYLASTEDGLPAVKHDVALEGAGPALAAAALIAGLLEGNEDVEHAARRLLTDLRVHIRGRTRP